MRTQRQHMLNGEWYDAGDPDLVARRT
ncbi:MAG: hypothetical protein QOI89_3945, partial [Solirubrobacteraceae bacterium]|nr:hypothetical protein [Solirubrobacteraceae bacterium]